MKCPCLNQNQDRNINVGHTAGLSKLIALLEQKLVIKTNHFQNTNFNHKKIFDNVILQNYF